MSMIFDNTDSSNPFKAINEVHEAFRARIREHCSTHIIKSKWVRSLNFDEAHREYQVFIQDGKLDEGWEKLIVKMHKEIIAEFSHVCDSWMLQTFGTFDLQIEIKEIFQSQWDLVGPRPHGFLGRRVEGEEDSKHDSD